ncbi:hypothetical protein BRADI_3g35236v3 [Brachypodium distachyon]|uniref:Uncharacterized protein n=1 Tax=Brachypodium distachyon TaxID=15368 RepID=A0A0Q3M0X3_BRADI|nr:hypothetical protein BRADI_3g35236v3 [Brachypodium distachyon]
MRRAWCVLAGLAGHTWLASARREAGVGVWPDVVADVALQLGPKRPVSRPNTHPPYINLPVNPNRPTTFFFLPCGRHSSFPPPSLPISPSSRSPSIPIYPPPLPPDLPRPPLSPNLSSRSLLPPSRFPPPPTPSPSTARSGCHGAPAPDRRPPIDKVDGMYHLVSTIRGEESPSSPPTQAPAAAPRSTRWMACTMSSAPYVERRARLRLRPKPRPPPPGGCPVPSRRRVRGEESPSPPPPGVPVAAGRGTRWSPPLGDEEAAAPEPPAAGSASLPL